MSEVTSRQNQQGDEARSSHRDERRCSLVLAAYQLIAEKGFEQLRTRDVATRAGVNIATLHYYFASKADLIPGVVEHVLHEFRTTPASPSSVEDRTPFEQIRAELVATHDLFQAKPELFIVLSELVLHSLRDPSLQSVLQLLDEQWQSYLQHLITVGIGRGVLPVHLDARATATKLIILLKGFFFHQITSPGSIDFQQLCDDVEQLLLNRNQTLLAQEEKTKKGNRADVNEQG